MATVADLMPGDLVVSGGMSGVFIHRGEHPLYPPLMLVIWRLDDGTISLDALAANQEVDAVAPASAAERYRRLDEAIHRED